MKPFNVSTVPKNVLYHPRLRLIRFKSNFFIIPTFWFWKFFRWCSTAMIDIEASGREVQVSWKWKYSFIKYEEKGITAHSIIIIIIKAPNWKWIHVHVPQQWKWHKKIVPKLKRTVVYSRGRKEPQRAHALHATVIDEIQIRAPTNRAYQKIWRTEPCLCYWHRGYCIAYSPTTFTIFFVFLYLYQQQFSCIKNERDWLFLQQQQQYKWEH